MRFEDERYVRIYTRDTTTVLMLSWEERAVMWEIFRKVDRAGLLDLGEDGLDALAANIRIPIDIIERAMPNLLRRRVVELRPDGMLIVPRFVEAQEAKASDKARAKAARERARDVARAVEVGADVPPPPPSSSGPVSVTPRNDNVTQRDADVTSRDETVTRGHTASRGVTPYCAVPSRTDLVARERAVTDRDPEPKPSRTRGTRITDDWQPTEATVAWCRAKGVDAQPEVEPFVLHYKAETKNGLKADWQAAFRSWITKAIAWGTIKPELPTQAPPVWSPPAPDGEERMSAEEWAKRSGQPGNDLLAFIVGGAK